MWTDILKSKRGQKIYGSLYRKIIADYIESTGNLERYYAIQFVDAIFDTYYDAHKELRSSEIGNNSTAHKNHIKDKLYRFVGGYLPEEYESKIINDRGHVRVLQRKNSNSQTEDLEKIRTRSGDRLKLRDWEEFKKGLRAGLNVTVPRDIYNRKSNVRLTDGEFEDNKARLNVSFRALQGDRRYIHINFIEEEGDYYFTTIEGNIQLSDNTVIQTEGQLRERIIDLVEEYYIEEREEYDLREKEEEELTETENIRQLEAANPDSYWDREKGKLVQREIIPEDPPARDLNLEEAAKLGAKDKEKADKLKDLIAQKRSKKSKKKNIRPLRGKRGRRDVP
jgi:hypothetical protein